MLGVFNAVGVATGHDHWQKRPAQVLPITVPLVRALDELPAASRKKLAKVANPALFVLGCAIVVGPDLATEMRLRTEAKARIRDHRMPPRQGQAYDPTPSNSRPVDLSIHQPDLVSVPGGLRGVGE